MNSSLTDQLVCHDRAPVQWRIHQERLIDDTRRLQLSIAHVELPDGDQFEQYVLRLPKAVMMVVLDDSATRVLMMYRHRFVPEQWTWELPGGHVDPGETTEEAAIREVIEETGWEPRNAIPLSQFQPCEGIADFENLIYLSEGARDTGGHPDVNEATRIEWIPLSSVRTLLANGEIMGAGAQIGLLQALHRLGI